MLCGGYGGPAAAIGKERNERRTPQPVFPSVYRILSSPPCVDRNKRERRRLPPDRRSSSPRTAGSSQRTRTTAAATAERRFAHAPPTPLTRRGRSPYTVPVLVVVVVVPFAVCDAVVVTVAHTNATPQPSALPATAAVVRTNVVAPPPPADTVHSTRNCRTLESCTCCVCRRVRSGFFIRYFFTNFFFL